MNSLTKTYQVTLTGNQIELIYCGLRDIADNTLRNPRVYRDEQIPEPEDVIDLVNLAIANRDTANILEQQYLDQQ